MESSQLYAATPTHYSTEPLTTGPDYEPLLLLLALAGDVHPNPINCAGVCLTTCLTWWAGLGGGEGARGRGGVIQAVQIQPLVLR